MNVERTIEYILQMQAKAEVEIAEMRQRQAKAELRSQQAEAKAQREMAAIRTLIRAGMKMIAKNDEHIKELRAVQKDLAKAQKVTETNLQGLIDSMRRGGNGNHRNN